MSKLAISTSDQKTSADHGVPFTLVRFEGFIDAPNYVAFETSLERLVRANKVHVVLDFARLEYINSTGISAIIRFHGTLSERAGSLILIQVSRNVGLTMHLLGVTTLVPFLKTLDDAREWIDGRRDRGAATLVHGDSQDQFEALEGVRRDHAPVFVEKRSREKQKGTVILVVPREGPFSRIFALRLERPECDYHIVHSIEGLRETLGRWNPDLIVVDDRLEGVTEFIRDLKVETDHSLTSVIKLYARDADLHHNPAFRIWENDYLVDPFDLMNLFSLAESELRRVPKDKRLLTQQVKFQFSSERAHVEEGLRLVDRLLQKLELDDTDRTAVYASVKEAVDNAVLHGNRHDPESQVTVNFVVDPSKITFLVEDEGKGFDYEYFVSQLDSDEAFERAKQRIRAGGRGGLGILLMYKCSDRLEYSGRGNIVRLEKNLPRK